MLNILLPVIVSVGTLSLFNYGVNQWIEKSSSCEGNSKKDEVAIVFEKFLRKVKDYDKANIWLWLPLKDSKGQCGWKTVSIKGNEDKLRQFFKTNDYSVLLSEKDMSTIDLTNIIEGDYKYWAVPSMNLFRIDYIDTI